VGTPAPGGLVGRWSLDEGKGTTAKDSSSAGNTVRLEGTTTWATPGAPTAATSAACLAFDGNGAASTPAAGLPALTGPMSIVLWMRPSSFNNGKRTALAFLREGSAPVGIQIGQDTTNAAMWFYGDGGSLLTAGPLVANTWSLVAYTFDGTTHRLSVGTAAPASVTGTPLTAVATIVRFGYYGSTIAQRYVGRLDDVRIYDRALSAAEIRALAQP
jgi:hypothetical protein